MLRVLDEDYSAREKTMMWQMTNHTEVVARHYFRIPTVLQDRNV